MIRLQIKPRHLLYFLLPIIIGCQKTKNTSSHQDIYDFMKMVIIEQKLDVNYAIDSIPEDRFNFKYNDSVTFEKLLFNIKNKIELNTVIVNDSIMSSQFHPLSLYTSLSEEDISDMKHQKEQLTAFQWDNTRLGFNQTNTENWYRFSIPLFSKDRTKAVIMIKNLCPGLCGEGKTIMFTKENNTWKSSYGNSWLH